MKKTLIVALLLGCFFASTYVYADEYGDRFYSETPRGMQDFTVEEEPAIAMDMDEAAKELRDIMPAAGEEDVADDHSVASEEEKAAEAE